MRKLQKRLGISEVKAPKQPPPPPPPQMRGLRRAVEREGKAEMFATIVRLTERKAAGEEVHIRCGSIECRLREVGFFFKGIYPIP